MPEPTFIGALAILAFFCAVFAAATGNSKPPLFVSVILVTIILLLQQFPLGK